MHFKTNRDLFVFFKENSIHFTDYDLALDKLIDTLGFEVTNTANFRDKLRKWCNYLSTKWSSSNRSLQPFLKRNEHWLDMDLSFSEEFNCELAPCSSTGVSPPLRCKSFEQLSDRQKRRKTEHLRNCSDEMFNFVLNKKLRSDDDGVYIFNFIQNHPQHIKTIKEFCENLSKPNNIPGYNEKMLALYATAKLTRFQYNALRENANDLGRNIYPSYKIIQNTKKECYPDNITVSESGVNVALQNLLNHTSARFIKLLSDKIEKNTPQNLTMILKWGCDGASSQSQYKQSSSTKIDDSTVFISSLVPLKIINKSEELVVWTNEKPSSTRFCRPISFEFAKETKETVTNFVKKVQTEIATLQPYILEDQDRIISINYEMHLTMVDGKICNYLTETTSSMRCYICDALPKEMNHLSVVNKKEIKQDHLGFGLSSLHCWIRCFECLIHIAYRLDFKEWSAKSSVHKELLQQRKAKIQNDFRSKLGLMVDHVKQGHGTSNDGNTSRKFFANAELSASITGLNADIIKRFSTILQVISSGLMINFNKFEIYTKETAQMYVNLYGWYFMPVTVHKLLIHGPEIAKYAIVPIGQLSEDAQEANHKYFRSYREFHSRKTSRMDNNRDVFNNLLINSDPLISNLRPKTYNLRDEMPQEVKNLLDDDEMEIG